MLYILQLQFWIRFIFIAFHCTEGSASAIQWALCVTCGAWLALTVWDHYTYTGDMNMLEKEFLPTFQGIAEFFLDYLYSTDKNKKSPFSSTTTTATTNDTGFGGNPPFPQAFRARLHGLLLHTGPTTSPETSYAAQVGPDFRTVQLALSPAMDCSVLRQVR